MQISDLLDELDSELNGKRGLFNGKTDLARCREIVNELKAAVPQALGEAKNVIDNRKTIMLNADAVAKNVIREAEERAKRLTENSEVMKIAERQGRSALDETYRQCDAIVQKTKEHLDKVFSETEAFFESTLALLRTNRRELMGLTIAPDIK